MPPAVAMHLRPPLPTWLPPDATPPPLIADRSHAALVQAEWLLVWRRVQLERLACAHVLLGTLHEVPLEELELHLVRERGLACAQQPFAWHRLELVPIAARLELARAGQGEQQLARGGRVGAAALRDL